MYKDKGLNKTRSWVLTIFKTQLDSLSLDTASKDPKTQLQEYLQARGIAVPRYSVISTTGLDHNQQFKVECQVDGVEEVVCATASSRKKAEQKAASKILEGLLS